MSGQLEDVDTNFLIDIGAAISCTSEEKYRSLPRYWALPPVPKDPALSLSSASGHNMSIVGRYNMRIRVLGRTIVRPMYVLSGLSRQKAILGIDFIKEQQLIILPEEVYALYPARDVTVPPRTVMRLTSVPRDSGGRLLPVDTAGVVSSSSGSYGIWDAACKVQCDHTVDAIVSNTTNSEVKLSAQRPEYLVLRVSGRVPDPGHR